MKMTPLPAVCHLLSKVFGCEGYRDMFEKKKERLRGLFIMSQMRNAAYSWISILCGNVEEFCLRESTSGCPFY